MRKLCYAKMYKNAPYLYICLCFWYSTNYSYFSFLHFFAILRRFRPQEKYGKNKLNSCLSIYCQRNSNIFKRDVKNVRNEVSKSKTYFVGFYFSAYYFLWLCILGEKCWAFSWTKVFLSDMSLTKKIYYLLSCQIFERYFFSKF